MIRSQPMEEILTSKSESLVLSRKGCGHSPGQGWDPALSGGGEVTGVLFVSEERMEREINRRIAVVMSQKVKLSIYQSIHVPNPTSGYELTCCGLWEWVLLWIWLQRGENPPTLSLIWGVIRLTWSELFLHLISGFHILTTRPKKKKKRERAKQTLPCLLQGF